MEYPRLPKSFKGRFPFKICTTSFIYPDMYAPNIRMLGPCLDEIELLFFDSTYEGSFPSDNELDEMARLLKQFGMACNVHLPLDISLGDSESSKRHQAVETVRQIIRLTCSFNPTTYTVHFTYEEKDSSKKAVELWQGRIMDSFHEILKEKISADKFSVENLVEYPFGWVEPVIKNTGLHTCIDIGHFLERGENFEKSFLQYAHMTDILHIYGIKGHQDHLSLKFLPENSKQSLLNILKGFSGTVSVEVFSFKDLNTSLAILDTWDIL